MPTYQFEAMDATGTEIKDVIDAATEEEAQATIRQMGYFVTKIAVKKARSGGKTAAGGKKKRGFAIGGASTKQISLFTKQLSILQDAGLPILRSLRILENQQKPGRLKNALRRRRRRDRSRLHAQRSDGQMPQGLQPPVCQHDQGRRSGRCARSHSPPPRPSSWNGRESLKTQGQRRDDLSGRRRHGRRRHLDLHHAQDRPRLREDVRRVRASKLPAATKLLINISQVGRQVRLVHDAADSGRASGCSSSCSASSSTGAWAGTCTCSSGPSWAC